ncbi:TerB family tellurite resistance protein [Deltaproteobacteria bacterium TL4]
MLSYKTIDPELIGTLSSEEKVWMAQAIANMIVADGVVVEAEIQFFTDIISFLDRKEDVLRLVEVVKRRKQVELPKLEMRRKNAIHMVMNLAVIAISDNKLRQSEAQVLRTITNQLNLPPTVSEKVLRWASDLLALRKKEQEIMDLVEHPLL